MGRKIETKKIEDNTRRQVTFSKRRSSLIKKVEDISVSCDVDVAFVAFSPSGRVNKYCSRDKIEDLMERYANVPVDKRLSHIKNLQEKIEYMHQLDHVHGEEGKAEYLVKQIENLEMNIKKNALELQVAEANLRDFELEPEKDSSLHQLSWSERNLQLSLIKVKERKKDKMVMVNDGQFPFFDNLCETGLLSAGESSSTYHLPMEHSPQMNPYCAKDEEALLQELLEKVKGLSYAPGAQEATLYNNTLNVPISTGCFMDQRRPAETYNEQFYNPLENNSFYFPNQSTYPMYQSGFAFAPSSEQVNLLQAIPQEYPQGNFGDYIAPQYQLWQHAPIRRQQDDSISPLESFIGDSQNLVENYLVDFQPSLLESDTVEAPVENTMPGHIANNVEDNKVEAAGNINSSNSPALVEVAPPLQVSDDLYNAFPSEVALGGDVAWTQTNQGSGMWTWDDLYFQQNKNFTNSDN